MRHVGWIIAGAVLSGLAIVMGVRRKRQAARTERAAHKTEIANQDWENEGGAPAPAPAHT